MREAVNNNPVVQIAVIGVLFAAAGLMMLTAMGSTKNKKSPPASAQTGQATVVPATPGSTSPATGSAPATGSTAPSAGSAAAPAPTTGAPVAPQTVSPLVPGPGLPQRVMVDYSHGRTIVLLVVRPGGIDDRLVSQATRQLSGDKRVALYVTPANHIARYSRITEGVGVSQVPALVVVSPRNVSGGAPKGTVSYGFRGSESVKQAVRDAEYNGPSVGYDPG
jgi:hypothetical protein